MAASVRVGMFPPLSLTGLSATRLAHALAEVADAGLDHVCCGDHVSFGPPGFGMDGLVQATAMLTLHPSLPVHVGVYQLSLRHPVLVARQLVDVDQLAPGRLLLGVGIAGEDRHEVEIVGVDPATRGRRTDECLTVLRELTTGRPCTFHGEFFDIDAAVVAPALSAHVPIIVGGRSDAAAVRAGRLGDGWLGIWNSPRRFAEVVGLVAEAAAAAGRTDQPTRHAMQVWCGFGPSREAARAPLAAAMQTMYGLPFESFERYSPYGTPDDVAEFLSGYVQAGCVELNLIPQSADPASLAGAVADVKALLSR